MLYTRVLLLLCITVFDTYEVEISQIYSVEIAVSYSSLINSASEIIKPNRCDAQNNWTQFINVVVKLSVRCSVTKIVKKHGDKIDIKKMDLQEMFEIVRIYMLNYN